MSAYLDALAAAWDRAEWEALKAAINPEPAPETAKPGPRDCNNRPVTINVKLTTGKANLHAPTYTEGARNE